MIRNVPTNRVILKQIKYTESKSRNISIDNGFEEREFMGASVSIYAHVKLKLEVDRQHRTFNFHCQPYPTSQKK